MGADHIAQGGGEGKYEPQRPFNFQLVLSDVPGDKEIKLSVLSFSVPNISNEPIVIPYLNEDRKVAGAVTFETANLVCVDYIDPNTLDFLQQWRDLVYAGNEDGDGGVGKASDYKKDGDLQMFGPDALDSSKRSWKMIGLWPQSLQHGEFNMGSRTEYKQVTLILSVDRMYLTTEGGSQEF